MNRLLTLQKISKMKINRDIIWFFFFLVLFSLGLCSCSTLEKKISKAKVIAYENPKSFAEFCATTFPVTEKLIKGKDSLRVDTLIEEKVVKVPVYIDGDTIYVAAKCPKNKTIVNTVYRTDTLVKENTAKLDDLRQSYDKLDKSYKELLISKEKSDNKAVARLYWILGLGLLAVMAIYMLVKTK
jgi:gamma-glutamylcyclotransferase (GGCT)/AIG2-like uncharacterized protein YtfP